MASGQTKTYGFNQWQPEDKVLREEFNGDNEKMEQALTGLDSRVTGKAEQTEVDGLKTQMATKAAQSAVDSLSATVAKKYGTDNPYRKVGNYTGTGADTITISTGFQPAFVILLDYSPVGENTLVCLMGDQSAQLLITHNSTRWVETDDLLFTASGFTVQCMRSQDMGCNVKGRSYHYIAFR